MITMKMCHKCNVIQDVCNFTLDKRNKDGYNNWCKSCVSEYNKNYRRENIERIKAHRLQNREKYNKLTKNWHEKNKEYEREYRINYRERENYLSRKRRKEKPDEFRRWIREYKRKNRKNELIYMKDRLRNMVSHSFRRKGYTKNSKTYVILGADYETVWKHLKDTWFINYGTKYNGEPYQIDHIKPLASATTEEEIIKLCHYSNLQMLTPEDNWKKGKEC